MGARAAARGRVFINSGNLRNPRAAAGEWILDETVWVIDDLAEALVRCDPATRSTGRCLTTRSACGRTAPHRDRVFLRPRPLRLHRRADRNGLTITGIDEKTIVARWRTGSS